MAQPQQDYKTLREFWPYYLSEHLNPVNRALHVVGSLLGLSWIGVAIALRNPWLLLAAPLTGYTFAWIGHFVIEKNRPATFRYPLKSFLCDWILLAYVLTGKIGREVENLRNAGKPVDAREEALSSP